MIKAVQWMEGRQGVHVWNTAFDRKPSCSRREDYSDSDTLSRAYSAAFLASLVLKETWDGCQLASCLVCEQTEVLADFISANAEVCHTTGIEFHHLRWGIWRDLFAPRFHFSLQSCLLLLGYCRIIRSGLEARTVFDLFYGGPDEMIFH